MIHYMSLNEKPFSLILNKEKTIELRLNDEKRQDIKKGDIIVFNNHHENQIKLEVEVMRIHRFSSFKKLYERLDLIKCGYQKSELDKANSKDMLAYYSKEKQMKYGVLGIEIKVIE